MSLVPGTTTFSFVPALNGGTQTNARLNFLKVIIYLLQVVHKLSGDVAVPLSTDLEAPTVMLRPGGNETANAI